MNDLGIELSRENLDRMMSEADINKDGRIDYSGDFVHLIPSLLQAARRSNSFWSGNCRYVRGGRVGGRTEPSE